MSKLSKKMAKAQKKVSAQKQILPFAFLKRNLVPIILFVVLFILTAITYQVVMADKYYPLTFIGDSNISFLTKGQATKLVQASFEKRAAQKLPFSFTQGSTTLNLTTASASLDYTVLDTAFENTHQNPLFFFTNTKIVPKVSLNIDQQLKAISAIIYREPQSAKLSFDEAPGDSTASARINITEASDGIALDQEAMEETVENFLLTGKYQPQLPLKTIHPKVTTARLEAAKKALESLENEPLKLIYNNTNWTIEAKQLLTILDLETGGDSLLDKGKTNLVLDKIASEIDQEVQEGLFEFNPNTKRVSAFKPSQEGRKLNKEKAFQLLSEALVSSSKNITLSVEVIRPKVQTEDVNNLGIKELLGRGISNFTGSITNRIYNIGLAASRINGVLIAPGDTFSFNQAVGDITEATGFKKAYVIKEGRTVLDDGGGVCQVSTTVFRGVLNAGLPVIKRTAHAYRVGYYEQGFPPGLDATVFYPSVDFQFKNDTSHHILIQAYTSGLTLYVDLYGTPDGRTVSLTQPVVTNQTPAPPELRQDDPTLPKGTVKQVDWAAKGATVTFKRTVTRGGETLADETWKSIYKPWQAVYLVGTKE